jgi:hypothetical protein
MSETATSPGIEVGMRVICWSTGSASTPPNYALGKIVRVNKKSFKVVSSFSVDEPLFPIEADSEGRGHAKRGQGAWASTRHCVPVVSALGSEMRARMLDEIAENRATNAARAFLRDPADPGALVAAIRQLTELRARRTGMVVVVVRENGDRS